MMLNHVCKLFSRRICNQLFTVFFLFLLLSFSSLISSDLIMFIVRAYHPGLVGTSDFPLSCLPTCRITGARHNPQPRVQGQVIPTSYLLFCNYLPLIPFQCSFVPRFSILIKTCYKDDNGCTENVSFIIQIQLISSFLDESWVVRHRSYVLVY